MKQGLFALIAFVVVQEIGGDWKSWLVLLAGFVLVRLVWRVDQDREERAGPRWLGEGSTGADLINPEVGRVVEQSRFKKQSVAEDDE